VTKRVKTKKKKTSAERAPVAAPHVLDIVLKLTETEVLKLSRYDSDQRAAYNELALLQIRRAQYLQQIDPKGILAGFDRELAKAKVDAKEAEDLGKAVRTEIEGRLHLQLSDYSFDDTTGVLHHVTSTPATPGNEEK